MKCGRRRLKAASDHPGGTPIMSPLSPKFRRTLVRNLQGYAFVSLAVVGMIAFELGPMVQSFWLSFTEYDILTKPQFVGLRNYSQIIRDELFWVSLRNTAYYVGVSIPLRLAIALWLAMLLNQKVRGIGVFRTLFYLPTVTAGVAVALLWQWVFEPTFGLVNYVLRFFGINGPAWLGGSKLGDAGNHYRRLLASRPADVNLPRWSAERSGSVI